MPLCLLCPTDDQPFFFEISELTKHTSMAHPLNSAGHPPPQAVSATKCCVCNKKFTTPVGLSSHQKAKGHYPPRSTSPRQFASSKELAHPSETRGAPSSPAAVTGNAKPNKSDVAEQRVIHRCSQCQASFDSLDALKTHQSSHGKISCSKCNYLFSSLIEWNDHFKQTHQNTQPGNRQAEPASDSILASYRSPSPAIVRPASSQSISNKSVSPNSHGKGRVLCELCKKEFKGQAGLQAHIAAKHPAGAECVICHSICSSTAALEEHVDTVHSCAVCQDGILRDAQTLSDHILEHSRPILCKKGGTRYRTEEEHRLHSAAADNHHLVSVASLGCEDDNAHANVRPIFPKQSPKPSSRRSSTEPEVKCHVATIYPRGLQCDVCHEAYLSQTELDVHVVTVHSCPICHDGIYMDMRTLEEHLEQHRSPYACPPCGLAFAEEDQLLEHYNNPASDIHPHCEKCRLGFENNDMYTTHVDEVHPRIACDACEGEFFDQDELAIHYSSSRKHPKCEKCGVGFRDRFDYTDHGASAHPECHCYLCQWQFDTPDVLQNHIRHFFNHPKCQDCNLRFADADAYQYHLFTVHRPNFGDRGRSDSAVETNRESKILQDDLSSPLLSARALDPVWGFEGSTNLPYASFIPLPPSLSGYSSPTSQRVTAESGDSSGSQSRSSTLSVEQRSPTDGHPWNVTIPSLSLDTGEDLKVSPEFDHSPLSTLPAVGTPLMSSVPTVQSVDLHRPFSPRPEKPSLFSLTQGIADPAATLAEDEADSDSDSSFAHSPPLVSPVIKLPDSGAVSQSSTSGWTATSDTDSRRSSPPRSVFPSKGMNGAFSSCQTATSEHNVPQLSLLVPSSTLLPCSVSNSGCPSSISPESAGISVSASMTPEYLREARAYLSLTHQAQEPPSPPVPHSPGISSPILSSAGLAIGERGRRREVRFEDNIMAEAAWDRQSTSSDSSLNPPVVLPRPSLGKFRANGVSKLPRFSAFRRPARKWTSGQANHVPYHAYSRRSNGPPPPSYHCRSCYKHHCEEPTTTTCGHLFCYEYVLRRTFLPSVLIEMQVHFFGGYEGLALSCL
ncbi:hypothetical protein EV363DRAFT_1275666 [Boletus edulis]|nr:hypothetical protein EV363DRAFT_1275666 [Boletus edulis]